MRDLGLILVVSEHCRLCEKARLLLRRLEIPFREVDLEDDEAHQLAGRGVPVIFFPVLVEGERAIAYGDISERDLRLALEVEEVA